MYARVKNIAAILFDKGLRNIVISPGSRNAALTVAFVEHGGFTINMIVDERSAGFIALGQSIASQSPTALLCTSGTASVNYYPAICEAFYQGIPLIVLTADRPAEWIDHGDGQSIRQQNVFASHVLKSYQLLADYENTGAYNQLQNVINEAYDLSKGFIKKGPVHVNIPFREPFYPVANVVAEKYRVVENLVPNSFDFDSKTLDFIREDLQHFKKILVFKGQEYQETNLEAYCENLAVCKDVMGEQCKRLQYITMHDFLFNQSENLPDLVITIGKNVLSKPMKQAFRSSEITHWHIGLEQEVADVFSRLSMHIQCSPQAFFDSINIQNQSYRNELFAQELKFREKSKAYFDSNPSWTEFSALNKVIDAFVQNSHVHLGNSMPVRYVNHLHYVIRCQHVYANRGTSGIDGSLSTAIGIASILPDMHYIITGDLSFFYDRNSLWNDIDKSNVRIILLNNHGGGIFDIIKGPKEQNINKDYFTTPNTLNAKNTASDFGMDYCRVSNHIELASALKLIDEKPCAKGQILEIETDIETNTAFYKEYLKELKS
jgi:2-succinyl-5-enolpyruvyl-6-hydroxy-3-cyclohexene-1-carboxylate synthase